MRRVFKADCAETTKATVRVLTGGTYVFVTRVSRSDSSSTLDSGARPGSPVAGGALLVDDDVDVNPPEDDLCGR